jgi:patatin-like phospholipase/acyl hydrolase
MQEQKIRLLTIDGGGILGVIPAMILQALETKLQQHTNNPNARIVDYFDFFAGTSTGGIITTLLLTPDEHNPGRPRYNTNDIVGFYTQYGPQIFKASKIRGFLGSIGLAPYKYNVTEIETLLKQYLGDAKLSQLLKPCLIPAYHLENAATYFFCAQDHAQGVVPAREFFLRDVCRATSAAPSYFEPATVVSGENVPYTFIDGGVFANNPTLCAIAEVGKTAEQYTPLNMSLLSLGTGKVNRKFELDAFKDRIAILNVPDLIKIMMGGVAETTDYIVNNVFTNLKVKDNYLRLEPSIADQNVGSIDNATPENIVALQKIAASYITNNDQLLDQWAQQLAVVA